MKGIAVEIPDELVEALRQEAREAGAAAARALVQAAVEKLAPVPAKESAPVVRYARIREYATRVGFSVRTLHDLIGQGLPTIGEGKLRRVEVAAADAWIAARLANRPRRRGPVPADR
jgi:hypothetical protein